jgi:hypothetical protein
MRSDVKLLSGNDPDAGISGAQKGIRRRNKSLLWQSLVDLCSSGMQGFLTNRFRVIFWEDAFRALPWLEVVEEKLEAMEKLHKRLPKWSHVKWKTSLPPIDISTLPPMQTFIRLAWEVGCILMHSDPIRAPAHMHGAGLDMLFCDPAYAEKGVQWVQGPFEAWLSDMQQLLVHGTLLEVAPCAAALILRLQGANVSRLHFAKRIQLVLGQQWTEPHLRSRWNAIMERFWSQSCKKKKGQQSPLYLYWYTAVIILHQRLDDILQPAALPRLPAVPDSYQVLPKEKQPYPPYVLDKHTKWGKKQRAKGAQGSMHFFLTEGARVAHPMEGKQWCELQQRYEMAYKAWEAKRSEYGIAKPKSDQVVGAYMKRLEQRKDEKVGTKRKAMEPEEKDTGESEQKRLGRWKKRRSREKSTQPSTRLPIVLESGSLPVHTSLRFSRDLVSLMKRLPQGQFRGSKIPIYMSSQWAFKGPYNMSSQGHVQKLGMVAQHARLCREAKAIFMPVEMIPEAENKKRVWLVFPMVGNPNVKEWVVTRSATEWVVDRASMGVRQVLHTYKEDWMKSDTAMMDLFRSLLISLVGNGDVGLYNCLALDAEATERMMHVTWPEKMQEWEEQLSHDLSLLKQSRQITMEEFKNYQDAAKKQAKKASLGCKIQHIVQIDTEEKRTNYNDLYSWVHLLFKKLPARDLMKSFRDRSAELRDQIRVEAQAMMEWATGLHRERLVRFLELF